VAVPVVASAAAEANAPKAAGELDEPLVVPTVTVKSPAAGAQSTARGAASKASAGVSSSAPATKPSVPHITKEPRY
jgi:hypothetical protein